MSTGQPSRDLKSRLGRARRRWLAQDAAAAVTGLIGGLVPVFLAAAILDYRFDWPRWARGLELTWLAVWTGWLVWRVAVPAMRVRRDLLGTALRIESAQPDWAGRLASWVQFRQPAAETGRPQGDSTELIEAMCRQVEERATRSDGPGHWSMVPPRGLAGRVVLAGAALAAAAVVVAREPSLAGVWARRTLRPASSIRWPARTGLDEFAHEYRLPRGESLEVTGRLTGLVPRTGDVCWRQRDAPSESTEGRGSLRRQRFEPASDGRFVATIGPLWQSGTVWVEAGDLIGEQATVRVVSLPEVSAIGAVLTYPAFTGWPPRRIETGDVRAIVGTRVVLTVTADQPLERMEVCWEEEGGTVRTLPLEMTSSRQGHGRFVVRSRARYTVHLADAHGLSSKSPPVYVVEPVENDWPTVTLRRPGHEHLVTPTARVSLIFETNDDFGIAETALWYHRGPPESPPAENRSPAAQDECLPSVSTGETPVPHPTTKTASKETEAWQRQVVPFTTAAGRHQGEYVWDISRLGLHAGDEVHYYLAVRDEGEHRPAAVVERTERRRASAGQVLRVCKPDEVAERLMAEVQRLFDRLDRLVERQSEAADRVLAAIASAPSTRPGPGGGAGPAERRLPHEVQKELKRQADADSEYANEIATRYEECPWPLVRSGRTSATSEPTAPTDNTAAITRSPSAGLRRIGERLRRLSDGPMAQVIVDLEAAESFAKNVPAGPRSLDDPSRTLLISVHKTQGEVMTALAELAADRPISAGGTIIARRDDEPFSPRREAIRELERTLADLADERDGQTRVPTTTAGTKQAGGSLSDESGGEPRPTEPEETGKDEATARGPAGEGTSRTVVGRPIGTRPPITAAQAGSPQAWAWNAPSEAREVVRQSFAERLPPDYAPAIEHYYRRLNLAAP